MKNFEIQMINEGCTLRLVNNSDSDSMMYFKDTKDMHAYFVQESDEWECSVEEVKQCILNSHTLQQYDQNTKTWTTL